MNNHERKQLCQLTSLEEQSTQKTAYWILKNLILVLKRTLLGKLIQCETLLIVTRGNHIFPSFGCHFSYNKSQNLYNLFKYTFFSSCIHKFIFFESLMS